MFGKLAEIELLFKRLAEEAAIAVHENQIEGVIVIARAFDHLLKYGPSVIAGRRACFDEFGNYFVTFAAAPGP